MSKRLNQEKEKKLKPSRLKKAIEEIEKRGFHVRANDEKVIFSFEHSSIVYWVYSGWASGKSIKDGRGLKNLLEQLDR